MNKRIRRFISAVLIITFAISFLPVSENKAYAAVSDTYTLENDYIRITVSGKNGGFSISTVEGNRLIKSDNNKKLLYHNDEFDTSFTSFQVLYPGGRTEEYVFGGNYTFLGLGSNEVATVKDASGITSTWTVDNLTFTQRIELANLGSSEHGMVVLSYRVKSGRSDSVSVKQRLLLDTALGEQDYAHYQVIDINNNKRDISSEQIIASDAFIPQNFFGFDDPEAPGLTAYTVNKADALPYQVAFAHWNNLAATAFDFNPDPGLNFTNKDNLIYQTADSAYALYYDMGIVAPGMTSNTIVTNYGVYSNAAAAAAGSIAVNVTSPLSLSLSTDKTKYEKTDPSLPGESTFSIQVQLENYFSDTVMTYDKVTLAFYTSNGIIPLDGAGNNVIPAPSFLTPYTMDFMNFGAGEQNSATFYFKAIVGESAGYRKVDVNVFDTSKDTTGSQTNLTSDNLIGSRTFYILCPGGDNSLPKVTFTGRKPDVLYFEGTRHLYLTGTNIGMLNGDKSQYSLFAYNKANNDIKYKIDSNNILFPEENVLDIIFTESMAPGVYELKFELTDAFAQTLGSGKVLTSPALTVIMSEDLQYRNNYYGIIAVVQEGKDNYAKYLIKSYKNEESFNAAKGSFEEILLALRGEFIAKEDPNTLDTMYVAASVKTKDKDGNDAFTNTVTINNCIDFEDGTLSVYYNYLNGEANSVYVDFDGSLYTSDERSSIWKGKAALTEIKNGQEFGLVPYNNSGVKMEGFNEKNITLIWPNALGLGQTLAGMIFKMTYGSLGIMYDTTASSFINVNASTPVLGNLLSFSAVLDLGFLIPKSKTAKDSSRNINVGTELYWISEDPKSELRGLWNHYYNQSKTKTTQTGKEFTKGQASVLVDDILFGCGKGFMGVNFSVNVALPAYVDAMPSLTGTLTINTINNWSFGVKGKCQFTTITIEAELNLKSYKNIPIPDKLNFYIAGFEPGVNIDGFGVLWITGGGGGFDKLYDTIFLSNGIPPLKLLLSVAFDVFKVLSARADLSLSLRGIGLKVSGVKIKATNIEILKRLQLQFDWYPDIYFLASVSASYYGILNGEGYIVVIDNDKYSGFVEGFIRATLTIPGAIPFIGGMELAGIDLGVNTNKIWGAAKVLSAINLSVVYYWGGEFEFSLKKNPAAAPTFPELLGLESIPVYYDAENGRTLYACIGGNVNLTARSEITKDLSTASMLMAVAPSVKSNLEKVDHIVNAGQYTGTKYAYSISFDAEGPEDAASLAAGFTIKDELGNDFNLQYYSSALNNHEIANANVTFDSKTGKGTLGIVLANSAEYDKNWLINTSGTPSDIVLFEIGEMPTVTNVHYTENALDQQKLDIDWTGTQLDELDRLSFFLTKDADGEDSGDMLLALTSSADITAGSASAAIPDDLPSGTYYLKTVFSQEDYVNGVIVADTPFSYVNPNQPSDPVSASISNSGDLTFEVDINEGIGRADGYVVNVYEIVDGKPVETDVMNMTFDKVLEEGVLPESYILPEIHVGGSYESFDMDGNAKTICLKPGSKYKVGVKSYKYVDKDNDGVSDYLVYGTEVLSNEEILNVPTPPNVSISAVTPFKTIVSREWGQDSNGDPAITDIEEDTFNTSDVEFLISSDSIISGNWLVDDFNYSGEFTNTDSFQIALAGLVEGAHTLNVSGKDTHGDGFRVTKVFKTDTLPPRLLLSSPISGSLFGEDGSVKINGITDADAVFSIDVDGVNKVNKRTIEELGGSIDAEGVFSFNIIINPGVSSHKLKITVSDKAGNQYTQEAAVMNAGLSEIESVSIYADNIQYTNQNLTLNSYDTETVKLSLAAKTQSSSFFINDYELLSWEAHAVEGSAAVCDDGMLTIAPNSIGFVTGGFKVAENAALTASATFGADVYGEPIENYYTLTLGARLGGTVLGSGSYAEGTQTMIYANPSEGYKFVCWRVMGNTPFHIAFPYSAQTSITIPDRDIVLVAEFEYIMETEESSGGEKDYITAKAGQRTFIPLGIGMDKNRTVVCVMVNGVEKEVAFSADSDGRMYFIAPVNGDYYLKEINPEFTDTARHWANEYIDFVNARGLFKGVGNNRFAPDNKHARSMFVSQSWEAAWYK